VRRKVGGEPLTKKPKKKKSPIPLLWPGAGEREGGGRQKKKAPETDAFDGGPNKGGQKKGEELPTGKTRVRE